MLVSGMSLFEMRYLMDNFPQGFSDHKVYDGASCASVGVRYHATVELPSGRQAIVTSVNRYIISIEGVAGVSKVDPECEAVEAKEPDPEWYKVCNPADIITHETHINEALKDVKVNAYVPLDTLSDHARKQVVCSLLPYECAGAATVQRIKVRHSGLYLDEGGITIHEIEPYISRQ